MDVNGKPGDKPSTHIPQGLPLPVVGVAEASGSFLIREGDSWRVSVEGVRVTNVEVEWSALLEFENPDGEFELRIETEFFLSRPGLEDLGLDPEERERQDIHNALRSAVQSPIAELRAWEDGRLSLSFADGSIIRVPVSEEYEAWGIAGPSEFHLVSLPGGSVAIWSQR